MFVIFAFFLEALVKPAGTADPSRKFPLACSAAAPSRLRHALSSVRLLSLVRCDTGAHFAAVVIANSLEGALLRVSLDTEFAPGGLSKGLCNGPQRSFL